MADVKFVRRIVREIIYDLDGCTVEDVIRNLQSQARGIRSQYKDVTEVRISYDRSRYDDSYELNMVGYAPENEKEKSLRETKEAGIQAMREKHEREDFERLKEKFGG